MPIVLETKWGMCVKVYTPIGEHGTIGGTYRIHFQRQDGCVWFSSWHMHLWLQSGGKNKKKGQRIRKACQKYQLHKENWILILNYSNKLAVYVYDKKKAVLFLFPSLLTFSPSQRKPTFSCHLTSIYIPANYFETWYVEW